MKARLALIVVVVLVAFGVSSVSLAEGSANVVVVVDHGETEIRTRTAENGTLMVQASVVFEELGFDTVWNAEDRVMSGIIGDFQIDLTAGKDEAVVYGETEKWDAPVEMIDGTVYAPVESFAGALGVLAERCEETNALQISVPEGFDPPKWDAEGPGPPLYVAFPSDMAAHLWQSNICLRDDAVLFIG